MQEDSDKQWEQLSLFGSNPVPDFDAWRRGQRQKPHFEFKAPRHVPITGEVWIKVWGSIKDTPQQVNDLVMGA